MIEMEKRHLAELRKSADKEAVLLAEARTMTLDPATHPRESLRWFTERGYPEELIHAVEAHAFGYNGYATLPRTKLAAALLATDELCGLFYAYRKMNPVRYGEMKPASIRKKIKDTAFAAKVDRATIFTGCEHLSVPVDDHVANVIRFLAAFD